MVVVVEAVEVTEVVLVVPGVVVDVDVAVAHEAKIIDDTIRMVSATEIIPRFIGPPVFFLGDFRMFDRNLAYQWIQTTFYYRAGLPGD